MKYKISILIILGEYLSKKEYITFNKYFADELIFAGHSASSLHETLINEIIKLHSNSIIILNIKEKTFKIGNID